MASVGADIAIVGMSGRFPEAASFGALHHNLAAGRDSVRPIPAERLRYSTLAPDPDYPQVGCLDRIDLFDHDFFGISLREAELMDPHQRVALELVAAAVENAGYRLDSLRGSDTAVFLVGPRPGYASLYDSDDPLTMLADAPSALPGRVAYAFDLRGPALAVDAGCCGSLVTVHQACRELATGAADLAVAGGVSLSPRFTPRRANGAFGDILAADDRCKAFAADADGAGEGEGGAILLLKRLADAVADRDHIHAIVKGSAVNHNGRRSNGLAAPSPRAQSEVIGDAWDAAQVDPATVGYVEAHGSGTSLGDVIEVQGLTGAFHARGVTEPRCWIGSVKTNIGHLDAAAGVAGLVKAVLSLRHATLYETLHFRAPNPLIDFDAAPVAVNDRRRAWEPAGGPRRAGVSSFSLAGTNVHVVLEEAPAHTPAPVGAGGRQLVTVSAKTPAALRRSCEQLAEATEETDGTLAEVAHVLNRGRDDHRYRLAWVVADLAELRDRLREGARQADEVAAVRGPRPLVLLCGGDTAVDDGTVEELADAFPAFGQVGDRLDAAGLCTLPVALTVHLGLHEVLRGLGVREAAVLGTGVGNLAVRVIRDGLSLDEAVAQVPDAGPAAPDPERLAAALERLAAGAPVFLELGAGGALADAVAQHGGLSVISTLADGGPLAALARLYVAGVQIDWERHYQGAALRRIELPTYPFEPTRCWCRPLGDAVAWDEGAASVPASAALDARQDSRPSESQPDASTASCPSSAAPAAGPAPASATSGLATSTEDGVAALYRTVLKAAKVDGAADYFELGGTSVTAAEVIAGIEGSFGVRVTFEDLYGHSTVAALAERITALQASGEAADDDEPRLVAGARDGQPPLSFGQERLWFLDQLEPGSALYNVPMAYRLQGELDVRALGAALTEIVRRHEVLRSRFASDGGQPRLVIDPEPRVDLRVADAADADTERLLREHAVRPFDLATGPLLRALLVRRGSTDHVLQLVFHHIVDDGWSPAIVGRELSALYGGQLAGRAAELPALPLQYADYARWQRRLLQGERLERELGYWRDVLADPPVLDLPTARPRPPVQSFAGDLVTFVLPAEVAAGVRALSRQQGATTFVTMLAAFQTFLHRRCRQDDIVVGTPTAGRDQLETRALVGFFNNTLALRGDLSGDPTFAELLRRLRGVVAGALDHAEVPFERIVEALAPRRDLSRNPYFDVMYSHQNTPGGGFELPGLRTSEYGQGSAFGLAPGTAKFDLTLGIHDDEGQPEMPGVLEYATDLFDEASAQRMVDEFVVLLRGIVAEPARPLSELPLLDAEERRRLLVKYNDTATAYEPRCFHELVADQARRTPDTVAVEAASDRLTYGELDRRANQLAHHLQGLGVGAGDIVGICLRRSPELVVALLAAMKAGAAYLPLDPSYPGERLAFMLADAGAQMLVTETGLRDRTRAFSGPVTCLDAIAETLAGQPAGAPAAAVGPDDLAYVIYTSGSTGRPKGVMVAHRGVRNLAEAQARAFGAGPGSRVLQFVSISFDASVSELLLGLTTGATLVLSSSEQSYPDAELVALLRAARITHLTMPPSVLAAMPDADLPDLEVVIAAGEACPPEIVRRWGPAAGAADEGLDAVDASGHGRRLFNPYGPTEATVYVTLVECSEPQVVGVIGRPMPNTRIHLLDAHQQPVPVGVPGELCIGGVGLARGYLGRPELTAERFVEHPELGRLYRTGDLGRYLPDGRIAFLGRADSQVKLRGFRIELGEVEAVLAEHPAVAKAAVAVRGSAADDLPTLVAYVVGQGQPVGNGQAADRLSDELRSHLRGRLPEYMVPSAFVALDSLPLSSNGKLDRDALPAPVAGGPQPERAGPRSATERALADIWSTVIGVDQPAVDDNFFDLGGHSLQATRVVARIHDTFQVAVGVRVLFERPTIAGLAEHLAERWGGADVADEIARTVAEIDALPEHEAAALLANLGTGEGVQR